MSIATRTAARPNPITAWRTLANAILEIDVPLLSSAARFPAADLAIREDQPPYGSPYGKRSAAQLLRNPWVRMVRVDGIRFMSAREALRWALRELRGTYLNKDTGWEIAIARGGIEKILSGSDRCYAKAHIQTVGSLVPLVENAVLVESRPSRAAPDIRAIHRLYSAVALGKDVYRVKITVKELPAAHRLYDQSLSQIEQSPANGACSRESAENRCKPGEPVSLTTPISAALGITGPSDLSINIADLLAGVKYDDGTYVFESNNDAVQEATPERFIAARGGARRNERPGRPRGSRGNQL